MAWTAPITAVAGSLFPAASYNQAVRDNLNETMPAKTTTLGSVFATIGVNQIAERIPSQNLTAGGSTTTSLTYTDLADGAGPSVSVQTGAVAVVWIYGNQYNTGGTAAWIALEISGATSQPASDAYAVQFQGTGGQRAGAGFMVDSLTPGLNTFALKYRVSTSGTGTFSQRRVAVWPF
jgi:hypothetical protein